MKKKLLQKILFVTLFFLPAVANCQLLFSESFSSGSLPSGWSNDSLGLPAHHVWIFNNQFSRGISGAGFDTHFAMFDSDEGDFNDSVAENASLTTPDIDISTATTALFLNLDQQFRTVLGTDGSTRVIEISTNGGTSWTIVDSSQSDLGYPNPAVHTSYDISSVIPATNLKVRFLYYGTWDWWWAIDNVEVISISQCSGAPNAGTAVSDINNVCSWDSLHLSLNGEDQLVGITFQWQSSTDNINWSDMAGDTMEFITLAQSSSSYYRCQLNCSGQNSYSAAVLVSQNAPQNCYCTGEFTFGCDVLDKVIFNTIYNVGSGCNGNTNNYILYPDTGAATTTIFADSIYDLIIASGTGSGNHGAGLWFDFDHNGDFQGANEFFHISDSIPELSSDFITSISIPSDAFGTTRMKVRYVYNNPVTQSSDCFSYSFGETEDYSVYIRNDAVNIEKISDADISVYPIPASQYLNISVGKIKGSIELTLMDQMGRICFQKHNANKISKLDISNFSSGIYFLKIESKDGVITKKVIVE
jgi:hypothetical protein